MLLSRSQRRERFRKLAKVESLESRQLMATDLLLTTFPVESDPQPAMYSRMFFDSGVGMQLSAQQWAEGFASMRMNFGQSLASGDLIDFASAEQAQDYLVSKLVNTWSRVFGQSVDAQSYYAGAGVRTEMFDGFADVGDRTLVRTDSALTNLQTSTLSNVQTVGVDEPDRFKISVNGYAFISTVSSHGSQVAIYDARDPANLIKVGSIDTSAHAQLHVVGDQLIVVTPVIEMLMVTSPSNVTGYDSWKTKVDVYDVTNKSQPTLQSSTSVSGGGFRTRFTENGLVLYGSKAVSNMQPLFIANDPTATYAQLPETSIGRFETAAEFSARVRPMVVNWLLPQISTRDAVGAVRDLPTVGDWSDLRFYEGVENIGSFSQNLVVSSFELNESGLKPVDVEMLVGGGMTVEYADNNTLYLAEPAWLDPSMATGQPSTRIHAFQFDNNGVELLGAGFVPGQINNSRMMDEFEGNLRVFTETREWTRGGTTAASTDLYILEPSDGKLKVIGQLKDVADGQAIYSSYFDDAQAFITTWVPDIVTAQPYPYDPLHAFDLSDPTKPVELSELVIPGVSTYLHRVDANHLLGIGYIEEQGVWRFQVSLYDVTDLTKLVTVDTWSSIMPAIPTFRGWIQDTLSIQFDATTGLLSVPFTTFNGTSQIAGDNSLSVFKIDPSAKDPLQLAASVSIDRSTGARRSVVLGETLFVISDEWFSSYSIDSFEKPLDRELLTVPGVTDVLQMRLGEEKVIDVIANDHVVDGRVTSVDSGTIGAKVTLLSDGRILYAAPKSLIGVYSDSVAYTVERPNGETYTGQLSVQFTSEYQPTFSQEWINVQLAVVDDQGNPVQWMTKGSEYWIEIQANDLRSKPLGIFAAYIDVAFDPSELSIVGTTEGIGEFTNGIAPVITAGSIAGFGAFNVRITPPEVSNSRIARIKVRSEIEGTPQLAGTPSVAPARESLIYGDSAPIAPQNVYVYTLYSGPIMGNPPVTVEPTMITVTGDINGDGERSPLDVLMVVEYLNRQSEMMRTGATAATAASTQLSMDVSGDGAVSPLDVLMIVEQLVASNASSRIGGEGESVSSLETSSDSSAATDQALLALQSIDFTDSQDLATRRRRSF